MIISNPKTSTAMKLNIREINTIEELKDSLEVEHFYPNTFVILEASSEEALMFMGLLTTQLLKCIKSFKMHEFVMVYNPYQLSNRIIIPDHDIFKEVEQTLREVKSSKYEPKQLRKNDKDNEEARTIVDLINKHGGFMTLYEIYFKTKMENDKEEKYGYLFSD